MPFKWVTGRRKRPYLFPPQISKVKRLMSQNVESSWRLVRKEKTDRFEEFLYEDFRPLYRQMFHVWDENHRLQAWFPYIQKVHPFDANWHICMDRFMC